MRLAESDGTALDQGLEVDVSVVIPIFNEQDNVGPLFTELKEVLDSTDLSFELLFVDDGSQDESVTRLARISQEEPNVKIIRLSQNCGQTVAMQAGFDVAIGRIVVTMDGDLQNDPHDIPRLVVGIEEGFDVVSGWRKERKDRAFTRRLPSIVANKLIGLLTGVTIHDNGCTLKAFRNELVKRASLYSEMHRFLVPMLSLSGVRIQELVVNHRPRRFGASKYGLSRIWKVLLDLLTIKMILRFAAHPVAWFAILGTPFAIAAIVAAIVSLTLYARSGQAEGFPLVIPATTVLMSFLASHFLLLGVFAELVVRTGDYHETDPVLVTTVGRGGDR